jgi:hypothetical protein
LTLAHTDADLDVIANAFRRSIEDMQKAGFLPGLGDIPTIGSKEPVQDTRPHAGSDLPYAANASPQKVRG